MNLTEMQELLNFLGTAFIVHLRRKNLVLRIFYGQPFEDVTNFKDITYDVEGNYLHTDVNKKPD